MLTVVWSNTGFHICSNIRTKRVNYLGYLIPFLFFIEWRPDRFSRWLLGLTWARNFGSTICTWQWYIVKWSFFRRWCIWQPIANYQKIDKMICNEWSPLRTLYSINIQFIVIFSYLEYLLSIQSTCYHHLNYLHQNRFPGYYCYLYAENCYED